MISDLRGVAPHTPLDQLIALHAEVRRQALVDPAQACQLAAMARSIAAKIPQDALLQAQAFWTYGTSILHIPDYAGALANYDAALAAYRLACEQYAPYSPPRDVRVVEIARVFCLTRLGRYPEAQQAVAAALEWLASNPDADARLTLLLNRSLLAGSMGDYATMAELATATVVAATELGQLGRSAQGWINKGIACLHLGRYAEAEQALAAGVEAAEQAGEPITIARGRYNQARLLRVQGLLFAALQTLRQAQAGLAQAINERPTILLEEAAIYERLGQLAEAQQAAEDAARNYARQSLDALAVLALLSAARLAQRQGQLTAARRLLRQARAQPAVEQLPTVRAELRLAEASLLLIPGQAFAPATLRKARQAAVQAIALLNEHGCQHQALEGELIVAGLDVLLGATAASCARYQLLAEQPSIDLRISAAARLGALLPAVEALPWLRQAAEQAIQQRRTLPMEELQARYSSVLSTHLLALAGCYLDLGMAELALASIWEAKVGHLLDLRACAGDSADSLAQIAEARATLAHHRNTEQEHNLAYAEALQQQQMARASFHARLAQEAHTLADASERALIRQGQLFADRRKQASLPNVAHVQTSLPAGAALLEYTQIGDELVCFVVRPDSELILRRLCHYRDFLTLLDRWQLAHHHVSVMPVLEPRAVPQLVSAYRKLFQALIAPLADLLNNVKLLLISPTEQLYQIPWAALDDGDKPLVEQVRIAIVPGGALLASLPPAPTVQIGPPRLLAYLGQGQKRLVHGVAELTTVMHALPRAELVSAASIADVHRPPPPQVLHLIAHAQTRPTAPVCSTIEFADGPMLVLDFHRLDLRGTELVVLSACETGKRPTYGDTALAIAGAFLCAGANAVLASLWSVSDGAAAALMQGFYAFCSAGLPPIEALRRAQRELRTTYARDWPAFQLWIGTKAGLGANKWDVVSEGRRCSAFQT